MATITVNGRKVTVDDNFRSLSPAEQEATVNEIAASMGQMRTPSEPHGVSEFQPVGVEGYNPQTGLVEEQTRDIGMLESGATGAADTATFGFGDELAAGVVTGLQNVGIGRNQDYGQNLADIRGTQTQAQEQNPGSYLTGQIGGGIAQGVAAGPGILASAPSLGGRMLGGMATGAAGGGAYGVGSGETMAERLVQGGIGAGVGGAVGGVFPAAATAVGAGARRFMGNQAGQAAQAATGIDPATMRTMTGIVAADDMLGPAGRAGMARAGSEAMLADAGPQARMMLDTATQASGPAARVAGERIGARVDRASQAVTKAMDDALGTPEGVQTVRQAIAKGSQAARGDAYEAAYAKPIDYAAETGQKLEQLVKSRVPKTAIDRANQMMRAEGVQSKQIMAQLDNQGEVIGFEMLPDVRQLDYIKRGLNQLAEEQPVGALGGKSTMGGIYDKLARDLRDTVKEAVPEYGTALETAADPIRRSQGVKFGAQLLRPNVARDEVEDFIKGATGPEKQAVAQGIRSQIDETLANVKRSIADPNTDAREAAAAIKQLSSRASHQKVSAVIGQEAADKLFDELDRASTAFELQAAIAQNSKTFVRQQMQQNVQQIHAPGPMLSKPLELGQRVEAGLRGMGSEAQAAGEQRTYEAIARMLTGSPQEAQTTFNAMQGLASQDETARMIAERLTGRLNQPGFSYLPSTQTVEGLQ